tara:strand:+ start:50 stop:259 length:210 start_codon:yes stop_codon:yes gene_type:complete
LSLFVSDKNQNRVAMRKLQKSLKYIKLEILQVEKRKLNSTFTLSDKITLLDTMECYKFDLEEKLQNNEY